MEVQLWKLTVSLRPAGCGWHAQYRGEVEMAAEHFGSELPLWTIFICYLFYWTSSFAINMLKPPVAKWRTPSQGIQGCFIFQTPADCMNLMKGNSQWLLPVPKLGNELRGMKMYRCGRDQGLLPFLPLWTASCFGPAQWLQSSCIVLSSVVCMLCSGKCGHPTYTNMYMCMNMTCWIRSQQHSRVYYSCAGFPHHLSYPLHWCHPLGLLLWYSLLLWFGLLDG